jgi:hypothetical protein
MYDAARFLDCTPEIAGPSPSDVVIAVEPYRGRFRIVQDDAVLREVMTTQAALEFLHLQLFTSSIADFPNASILHAACLRQEQKRLLLVGSKGTGKSTLTMRLIQAGYEIEGDEHVFLEGPQVVARPRGCRIRETSLQYLPEMAPVITSSPRYQEAWSGLFFNVDPRAFGIDWRIERGKVDCIFVLRPNHGGYSSIRPMPPSALIQSLMTETGWREAHRNTSIAHMVAVSHSSRAFDLSLGDHTNALRCIECVLKA